MTWEFIAYSHLHIWWIWVNHSFMSASDKFVPGQNKQDAVIYYLEKKSGQ